MPDVDREVDLNDLLEGLEEMETQNGSAPRRRRRIKAVKDHVSFLQPKKHDLTSLCLAAILC